MSQLVIHRLRLGLGLSLLLSACGSESTSGSSGVPAASARSLCPECLAGGETTDFGGSTVCERVSTTPIEWDSPLAREFEVAAVLSYLERPPRTSLAWRRQAGGTRVTGYERETEIELQIEALSLSHVQAAALSASTPEGTCSDFVQVHSRVRLSTVDGAIDGSFERAIALRRSGAAPYLNALGIEDAQPAIDLRDFSGTLDLELDAGRPHSGAVALSFSVEPDEVRGSLYITIAYAGEGGARDTSLQPLRAEWPSEGCAEGWARIDADQPLPPAQAQTPHDYAEAQRLDVAQSFPVAATWLDGASTELDLELGELQVACQSIGNPAVYYAEAPLRIRSLDGRLEATQTARVNFRSDEDSGTLLVVESEPTAREAFLSQLSMPELDWGADFEASFELYSRRTPTRAPSGDLQIIGFDGEHHNRLYLHWCSAADCESFPRPDYVTN